MKGSLPAELLDVLGRSTTADYVPSTGAASRSLAADPRYQPDDGCIDVTIARVEADVRVALLFSDDVAMILVQGTGTPRTAAPPGNRRPRPPRARLRVARQRPRGRAAALRRARRRGPLGPQRGARGRPRAPRARGGLGTPASTRSPSARPPPSSPSSAPTGSPSLSALPVAVPTPRRAGSRRRRPGRRSARPGPACLCADAPSRAASRARRPLRGLGAWVLRPHRVGDPVHAAHARDGGPHRRGYRPDGRDRPGLHPLAGALAGGRAHRRHGAPPLPPRRPRLEAHREQRN